MKQQSIIAIFIVAFPAIAFCGESKRILHKTVTVAAPVDQAFAAWTTDAGAQQFFAANTRIVLEAGGPYEILFNMSAPVGQRGSEGCRVVEFIPNQMLSFEWNAPPASPRPRNS